MAALELDRIQQAAGSEQTAARSHLAQSVDTEGI
jgi:hypothetical protein